MKYTKYDCDRQILIIRCHKMTISQSIYTVIVIVDYHSKRENFLSEFMYGSFEKRVNDNN
jgi:hypothetical protein